MKATNISRSRGQPLDCFFPAHQSAFVLTLKIPNVYSVHFWTPTMTGSRKKNRSHHQIPAHLRGSRILDALDQARRVRSENERHAAEFRASEEPRNRMICPRCSSARLITCHCSQESHSAPTTSGRSRPSGNALVDRELPEAEHGPAHLEEPVEKAATGDKRKVSPVPGQKDQVKSEHNSSNGANNALSNAEDGTSSVAAKDDVAVHTDPKDPSAAPASENAQEEDFTIIADTDSLPADTNGSPQQEKQRWSRWW